MTDRADWLTWRRGGIGGSDVAALVGLSPWQSPWSVWADKAGLISLDVAGTEAMEFGQRAEPMMVGYFHDRTGLYVAGEQTWCSNPADPWMRCTVDGFVFDHRWDAAFGLDAVMSSALGAFEAKATGGSAKEWEEQIPPHYQCQAQWTLAVTGLPTVWFGVLHLAFGRPQFRVYQLDRDEADIALLTAAARTFWTEHCLTGIPPATDGSEATTDALQQAWDPVDGETVEIDSGDLLSIDEVRRLKAEAKTLEVYIAAHENMLKAKLGEATALTHGVDDKGRPKVLATWKPQSTTRIDTAALKAAEPEIAAKYSTTSTSRVLRLTKSKGD